MSDVIKLSIHDEVYYKLATDAGIGFELQDHFAYEVPGARWMPSVKCGAWDGLTRLYSPVKGLFPRGILPELQAFCDARDYVIKHDYDLSDLHTEITEADILAFIETLNIHSNNEKIGVRTYQVDAVLAAIKNKRQLILSPTASGKSLTIYIIVRWLDAHGIKPLLVCPTTGLVEQMFGDFKDYSSANGWDVDVNVHRIYSGKEKRASANVVVTTWQSMQNLDPFWFKVFGAFIIDEAHGIKGNVLQKILSNCGNASYRLGLTGSLNKELADQMTIKSMTGPVTRVATTRELIDKGQLADVKIKMLMFNYSAETRKKAKGMTYPEEINLIVSHEKRNKFIRNLAGSLKGNTLILYTLVELHGKKLYELLKEKYPDRSIHFIHGKVDVDDREVIRGIMENNDDVIVVASNGTFATGINVKNIHNVIAASPTKSMIRVLQSIGRGLRRKSGKSFFTWYDLADKLSTAKKSPNHTFGHAVERLRIYVDQEFEYKITEINLEE